MKNLRKSHCGAFGVAVAVALGLSNAFAGTTYYWTGAARPLP